MQIAFLTVGDTSRRTGGYLYHARLFEGLRAQGIVVHEIVAGLAVSPAAQQAASAGLADKLADIVSADVIVVDALARVVCSPWIERWQAVRPLVTLVHELPSVAAGEAAPSPMEREAETRVLQADTLIAVSNHGRSILEARGVGPERITVVSPGCDRVMPSVTGLRRAEPPLVLCVAQWIPRKGIDTLVRAWNMLKPEATLELIGETDVDQEYAAEVWGLVDNGHENIIVSGAVDDAHLERSYAAASVFALPSRYEGYGMVYAEALLHGLPVVACTVGPVPEMLGVEAGVLVPSGDASALAGALARLLDDPELRERLAAGALQRARELPTWDDTVLGFRVVLEAAIAQRALAT